MDVDVLIRREEEEKERQEMERKEFELVMRKEISRKARLERDASARAARTPTNLRSPISCIMVWSWNFNESKYVLLLHLTNGFFFIFFLKGSCRHG